jgi:hypothetical protein
MKDTSLQNISISLQDYCVLNMRAIQNLGKVMYENKTGFLLNLGYSQTTICRY